jgi:hypothetical protein
MDWCFLDKPAFFLTLTLEYNSAHGNMIADVPISRAYRRPIFEALVLQVIFGVLSMMALDGGRIAHTTGIALLAFWVGATLIIFRRPTTPTPIDLLLVRFGFLPLLVLSFTVAEYVWSWHWVWKIHGAWAGS